MSLSGRQRAHEGEPRLRKKEGAEACHRDERVVQAGRVR